MAFFHFHFDFKKEIAKPSGVLATFSLTTVLKQIETIIKIAVANEKIKAKICEVGMASVICHAIFRINFVN